MLYPFPRDVEEFVESELASGKYNSEDELLCVAIRALRDRDAHIEELRKKLQPAADRLARGEGTQLSSDDELRAFFDDIKSRGRERLQAENSQ